MAKVLIAEDDPDQRQMLTEAVSEAGHHVEAVGNGNAATHKFSGQVFDLAILDVRMPGKDGLAVLKEIRQQNAAIPVIMVSAFTTEFDERLHLSAGATASLSKPYSIEELLTTIANALKSSTQQK
jgi:DNA-binding response OmpR family regulator